VQLCVYRLAHTCTPLLVYFSACLCAYGLAHTCTALLIINQCFYDAWLCVYRLAHAFPFLIIIDNNNDIIIIIIYLFYHVWLCFYGLGHTCTPLLISYLLLLLLLSCAALCLRICAHLQSSSGIFYFIMHLTWLLHGMQVRSRMIKCIILGCTLSFLT